MSISMTLRKVSPISINIIKSIILNIRAMDVTLRLKRDKGGVTKRDKA